MLLFNYPRAAILVLSSLCVAIVGCSGGVDGHYAVSGFVTHGGEVVKTGRVSFQPTTEKGGSMAAAEIIDGKYSIPAAKGLVPGEYSVVFKIEEKTGKTTQFQDPDGDVYEEEETVTYVPLEWGERSTQKGRSNRRKTSSISTFRAPPNRSRLPSQRAVLAAARDLPRRQPYCNRMKKSAFREKRNALFYFSSLSGQSAVERPVATSNSSIAGISIARDAKKYALATATKTKNGLPRIKLVAA